MEILDHILSTIGHDEPIDEILRGIHWTAVVSRFCGLSSTMLRDCLEDHKETEPPLFTGKTAGQLAQLSLSSDIGQASLGLAAINSLISIDIERCTEVNAAEIIMEKGRGKNVSIVGHFPFVDELRGIAKNLWVIEKWQRPGDYPEKDAFQLLPQSDVIAISSTTLINHTLESLLFLCPKTAFIMLLGPTTPMTDILFEYGVDMISGSMVVDTQQALTYIKQGANFRQLKRSGAIRLLTIEKM